MKKEAYSSKTYSVSVLHKGEKLTISKMNGSDWLDIKITNPSEDYTVVCLRSQELTEALRFMLGQLLEKE